MNPRVFLATTGHGLARAQGAADGTWRVDHLLTGRDVRCLASDPSAPGRAYVGTQGDGVLRSDDRGLTWQPAGLTGRIVKSLAVGPNRPAAIYAGVKPPGVFLSRDEAETWTDLKGFRRIFSRRFWFSPAEPPFTAYVQAIAISPADPHVIVAGIEFGAVVRSEDGGQTWSDHRPGAVRDCHSLTFHATNGDWVYEAGGGGAAVSQDGGRTWRQPREGLDRRYGWAVAADPAQPDIWYISASPSPGKAHSEGEAQAYIFRSVGGGPWEKLDGGLPQPLNHMPYALVTEPHAPGHIYAGLSNGDVWHSTDHGDTWRQLPFNLRAIHTLLPVI